MNIIGINCCLKCRELLISVLMVDWDTSKVTDNYGKILKQDNDLKLRQGK